MQGWVDLVVTGKQRRPTRAVARSHYRVIQELSQITDT